MFSIVRFAVRQGPPFLTRPPPVLNPCGRSIDGAGEPHRALRPQSTAVEGKFALLRVRRDCLRSRRAHSDQGADENNAAKINVVLGVKLIIAIAPTLDVDQAPTRCGSFPMPLRFGRLGCHGPAREPTTPSRVLQQRDRDRIRLTLNWR